MYRIEAPTVEEEHREVAASAPVTSRICHDDCRNLDSQLPTPIVDVTITSPPYFNLKDYGSSRQIGFGQTYEEYLHDLTDVFRKVYAATKPTGSLWIVIDSFRMKERLVPLPFDLANRLAAIGWNLQDVIIWKKERTIPWVPKGKTRSIFEYVLFLSKSSSSFKYFSNRVREHESIRSWWIRYPERYSPYGKLPEEIWEYDIPVQGSWGNGEVRHFCPLPRGLIDRILDLSTEAGDLVLDPFAGSGSVLVQAARRGRSWIGFETNKSYVAAIKSAVRSANAVTGTAVSQSREEFYSLIVHLRALKFARLLLKQARSARLDVKRVFVEPILSAPSKGKFAKYRFLFCCSHSGVGERFLEVAGKVTLRPPLSKFGLDFEIKVNEPKSWQRSVAKHPVLYGYLATNTHAFVRSSARLDELANLPIVAAIGLRIDSAMYAEG